MKIAAVIPSGAPQARRRGIAIVPKERPATASSRQPVISRQFPVPVVSGQVTVTSGQSIQTRTANWKLSLIAENSD